MIKEVKADSIEWNDLPMKFEAGTPNIAGGIGLAAALNWFTRTIDELGGWEKYRTYQKDLTTRLHEGLSKVRGVKLLSGSNSESLVSFEVEHMHTHDISTLLDERGIAIRAGFHCAQPLHEKLDSKGSVRASFGIYNTQEDIDAMTEAMSEIVEMF
jgi:cysteine desulfurase/selenocysteine lyase